jgi:hypothetical protein
MISRNPSLKEKLINKGLVVFNNIHASAMAPAVETEGEINNLIKNESISSIEVESMHIRVAVRANPRRTVTPIFTHSDDPLHSVKSNDNGKYASLAMAGPFFEGRDDPALREVLLRLIEEAARR